MKGVSSIISVILVVMIAVSLAAALYAFFSKTESGLTTGIEQQQQNATAITGAELKIINLDSGNGRIIVRNTGGSSLKNFAVYLNDKPVAAQVPSSLGPGEISQVNITDAPLILDQSHSAGTATTAPFNGSQQFTAGKDGYLYQLEFGSSSTQYSYPQSTLEIRNSTADNKLGSVLTSQTIVRLNNWYNVTLSNPVFLEKGKKYWIFLSYSWQWQQTSYDSYSGGISYTGGDYYPNRDYNFRTYIADFSGANVKITTSLTSTEGAFP